MAVHVPPRIFRRVPFETSVRLKFDRFKGFVEEYSANLSLGGMFIRTDDAVPVGTVLPIEFRLGEDYELITGRGRVVWVRTPEQAQPEHPAGMGIRFLELTPGSRELIFKMVERRVREGGAPFDVDQAADLLPDRPPEPGPGPQQHFAPAEPGEEDTDAAPFASLLRTAPPLELEPLPEPPGKSASAATDAGGAPAGESGERDGSPSGESPEAAEVRRFVRGDDETPAAAPAAEAGSPQGRLPLEAPAPLPGVEDLEDLELPPVLEGAARDEASRTAPASASVAVAGAAAGAAAGVREGQPAAAPEADPETGASSGAPPATAGEGAAGGAGEPGELPSTPSGEPPAETPPMELPTSEPSPALAAASAGASPDLASAGYGARADEAAAEDGWDEVAEEAAPPAQGRGGGEDDYGESFGGFRSDAFGSGSADPEADAGFEEEDRLEQTGAAYAGSSRSSSGRGRWIVAALVLLVLAGAGWWWFGMPPFGGGPAGFLEDTQAVDAAGAAGTAGEETGEVAPTPEPAPPAGEAAAGTPAGDEASAGAEAIDEAGAAGAATPGQDLAGTPVPPPSAAQRRAAAERRSEAERRAAPPAADGPRAVRLEDVSFVARDGGTLVLVRADSPLRPEDVMDFRIDGDNPRHVVQIRGIEEPYGSGRVPVGTDQVERVRAGLHDADGGESELHLVLDLASPSARVARVETLGDRLRIEVQGGGEGSP